MRFYPKLTADVLLEDPSECTECKQTLAPFSQVFIRAIRPDRSPGRMICWACGEKEIARRAADAKASSPKGGE